MAITDDFNPETKEEILNGFVAGAEEAFGESLDPDEESNIRRFYEPIAEYAASQQQDIAGVLSAARVDEAQGKALGFLGALIGVPRRPAEPATTRLRFDATDPVLTDQVIPSGSGAQTDEASPVVFETTESATIKYLDGFEDNDIAEYTGDTGVFSAQNTTVDTGSYALQATTPGVLINDDETVPEGSRIHYAYQATTGSEGSFLFGVDDDQNYYRAVLDEPAAEIRVEVVDGGSTTVLATQAMTVPTGSWLSVTVDWQNSGDITITVDDSGGSEIGTVTGSETSQTYTSGGIGYESNGSTDHYWDEVVMSAVSAPSNATTTGPETNVSENRLTVLSQSLGAIDSVTNPEPALNGRDEEDDDEYRDRIKEELSAGARSTLPALLSALRNLEGTRSVTIIENKENTADGDGRPGHSFEAVVEAPDEIYSDVAEIIGLRKAGGTNPVGGYAGTEIQKDVELVNGQALTVSFSEPTKIKIYIDIALQKNDTYQNNDEVRDNVVDYIGGVLSGGENIGGELGAGDDVLYNRVLKAVLNVDGVEDVTNLEIDTSSSPTGTSDISIADDSNATADATDGTIDVTASDF